MVLTGRDTFPEISVQNSMDWFGPTGKVSKKRVHLLRWTTFPGRTGWNFGWMDRAHYLHEKTGNSSWKIKWFAPFRLESFRKYGLWFEAMQFFLLFLACSADLEVLCSGSFFYHVPFYSFMFICKISTRVVCVNGKHLSVKRESDALSYW